MFFFFNIVVKTTVLLADIKDYGDVNSIYCKCEEWLFNPCLIVTTLDIADFTSKYPARAAYQVAALPKVKEGCTMYWYSISPCNRAPELKSRQLQ